MQHISETLRGIVATLSGNGTIELLQTGCCMCGNEFEAISIKGMQTVDLCPTCYDTAEREVITCPICQRFKTRYVALHGGTIREQLRCDYCNEQQIISGERISKLQKQWQAMCPAEYRVIRSERLPLPGMLQTTLNANCGISANASTAVESKCGIISIGPSGLGKTRITYERCRIDLTNGKTVKIFQPLAFGEAVSKLSAESMTNLNSFIKSLNNYEIVFFDDLGKERLTERVASELFGVIETRIAQRLTTYITMNETGGSLLNKFTDKQLGKALIYRMNEHFHVMRYNNGESNKEVI